MLLKQVDDKRPAIELLQGLIDRAPEHLKNRLRKELNIVKAGIKGEAESAYLIDFDLGNSKRTAVIHDLRLEINGRVAQIDHLLIHATLNVYVLETKHVSAGIKIGEDGQFLRWNDFKRCYEGMASPLAQNERHIAVLKDAFAQIELPTRLGVRLSPTFHSLVVLNPSARIDRPKTFDTRNVIKADDLQNAIERIWDEKSTLEGLTSIARLVSEEALETIGQQLVAIHRPSMIDFAQRYGIPESVASEDEVNPERPAAAPKEPGRATPGAAKDRKRSSNPDNSPVCRHCGQPTLSIQHGKFGYYFKCSACDGNTPIKLDCGQADHKEKLRKEGRKFFRECAACQTSALYFENTN